MNRKIENITDLREKIVLLERRKVELKQELMNDVEDLKSALNPLSYIPNIISAISGLRIRKGLFTKEGFADELKSMLRQLIIRSGTSFFSEQVYGNAFRIISKLFRKKKKRKENSDHEEE